ncbi:hypothetical protein jhhlp_001798 [Lomentospora prolificans]|uniref:G-protein coupled receptors family 2 profile 2 domain-containing protein n=1 Tax=Lomentospora prolificans TaxID=41688 RepID=A0A2N3NGW4_9PEZI|nr:hypothetical protein jhhlp_001798 [Lomentospora prolificans]
MSVEDMSPATPFGAHVMARAPRTPISEEALRTITILERVSSVPSLLASLFVIVTFLTSHAFRKPINRLVFYASFGNLMTNVATLMSRSFIHSPTSGGCQLQAFLIQMFMPADSLWTLSMAINVYLTFYRKFDAQKLRKMEIPYLVINYGVPFVPAFTYIFVKDGEGNRVYGDATLWCWVTPEWQTFRIVTFYGPVWLVILSTMLIYLRAGRTIYEKRKQLYNISVPESETDPYSTSKTTEVCVTTEVVEHSDGVMSSTLSAERHRRQSSATTAPQQAQGMAAYSVTISTDVENQATSQGTIQVHSGPALGGRNGLSAQQRRKNYEAHNAAWSYTKCAILFFSAILITWIPSSANRAYSVINNSQSILGLEYAASFVLPLQGLWNCLIYITTSMTGCKTYFRELGLLPTPKVKENIALRQDFSRRDAPKKYESESMTELQLPSRPTSDDDLRTR